MNPTTIGVTIGWWLGVARLAEEAGFSEVWSWDHFISRGRKSDPVLECWTTLTATAARTSRIRVGTFVSNVLVRHPQVLARAAASLQELSGGRLDVGLGAGGYQPELEAYGLDFPAPAERLARLEESVAVLRALWGGGPVDFEGRFYRLRGAWAHPVPNPPPRIVVGAERPRSARIAGRVGDAWTAQPEAFEAQRERWLQGVEESGRTPDQVGVVIELPMERRGDPFRQPLLADLAALADQWAERGATEIVIGEVTPPVVPALLAAAERAGLAG